MLVVKYLNTYLLKAQLWFWGNTNRLKRTLFHKPSGYKSPEWEGMETEQDEKLAIEQDKALKKYSGNNG
jgi:hypothetical protein